MKNLDVQYSTNRDLSVTMQRLSSGLRINTGADDPSGLAITQGMKAHYRGIDVALINAQEALSYCRARDSAMAEQQDIVNRIRELAVRAANEATLTTADMTKLNNEAQALVSAMDAIGRGDTLRSPDSTYLTGSSGGTSKLLYDPGQLDVCWILDQTGSMGVYIASIAAAADNMFSTFKQQGFDLRMGAVGYWTNGFPIPPALDPNLVPPGSPQNAISGTGTQTLDSAAGTFRTAQVQPIGAALNGSLERGLDACLETISYTGIYTQMQQRPNAQRIFILISDEDSDDAGSGLDTTAAQQAAIADILSSRGIKLFVAQSQGGVTDTDYSNVASLTGGVSTLLDVPGAWVNFMTNQLLATGGAYQRTVQIGADNNASARLTLDFETVCASTTNLTGVNLTSNATALASIDTAQSALDFISDERAATGVLMHKLEQVINDLTADRINTTAASSRIADTDFALTATDMAKQQIIMNSSTAISAQSNVSLQAVLSLIGEQGIGQGGVSA